MRGRNHNASPMTVACTIGIAALSFRVPHMKSGAPAKKRHPVEVVRTHRRNTAMSDADRQAQASASGRVDSVDETRPVASRLQDS